MALNTQINLFKLFFLRVHYEIYPRIPWNISCEPPLACRVSIYGFVSSFSKPAFPEVKHCVLNEASGLQQAVSVTLWEASEGTLQIEPAYGSFAWD